MLQLYHYLSDKAQEILVKPCIVAYFRMKRETYLFTVSELYLTIFDMLLYCLRDEPVTFFIRMYTVIAEIT